MMHDEQTPFAWLEIKKKKRKKEGEYQQERSLIETKPKRWVTKPPARSLVCVARPIEPGERDPLGTVYRRALEKGLAHKMSQ